MRTDLDYARQLDSEDVLGPFRDEFVFGDPELIYMDGNSLGRLPKRTHERLAREIEVGWGDRLIRAWNEGWYEAPERVGGKIAALVGASPDEVIIADSTSVNLYKLAHAALKARPGRRKIVTDELNFPSDLYILQGLVQEFGPEYELVIVSSPDGLTVPTKHLQAELSEDTALLTLSHTTFKSGFTYDMAAVTGMAQEAGALTLWDLSHSVGALNVELGSAGAELAVGCTYKYLSGGPGAPAFLYVRADLQETLVNPISGWFSQQDPFEMALAYQPTTGMRRFLTGSPPTLSLLGIEEAADLLREAGIERLREKSIAQTEYLIGLWEQRLKPLGFDLKSPGDSEIRGSHVSIGHEKGLAIVLALIREAKVLPDFRPPDNIRLGLAPIYTSFEEIHQAVDRIVRVVEEELYQQYEGQLPEVT